LRLRSNDEQLWEWCKNSERNPLKPNSLIHHHHFICKWFKFEIRKYANSFSSDSLNDSTCNKFSSKIIFNRFLQIKSIHFQINWFLSKDSKRETDLTDEQFQNQIKIIFINPIWNDESQSRKLWWNEIGIHFVHWHADVT
jgi:hypothetical protein